MDTSPGMLVGTEEAAAYLGVSVQYVRRLARDGRIRATRGSSGEWLLDASQLGRPARHLSAVPVTATPRPVRGTTVGSPPSEGERRPATADDRADGTGGEGALSIPDDPMPERTGDRGPADVSDGAGTTVGELRAENARLRAAVRRLAQTIVDLSGPA